MKATEIVLSHDAVRIIYAIIKHTGSVIIKREDLVLDSSIDIVQLENGDLKIKLKTND